MIAHSDILMLFRLKNFLLIFCQIQNLLQKKYFMIEIKVLTVVTHLSCNLGA